MFPIILYKNLSDENVVVKNIAEVGTIQGNFKTETSILSPSVTIEWIDPTSFNYVYIPILKRYYFVKDITINKTNLMTMNLNVDVLMTYGEQIKSLSAVIARQEHQFNLYLIDNQIQSYNDQKIYTINFDGHEFSDTLQNILVVSGGNVSATSPVVEGSETDA